MFKRHGDIETTRPMTTRRLACFVRDKTTVWQRKRRVSLTTRRKGEKDIGCVVTVVNATRKVYQISHHNLYSKYNIFNFRSFPCHGILVITLTFIYRLIF
jgi:hypothetical protein